MDGMLLNARYFRGIPEDINKIAPKLFGTRDWFRRRQFFHEVRQDEGAGGWFQDDSGILHLLCTLFLLLSY